MAFRANALDIVARECQIGALGKFDFVMRMLCRFRPILTEALSAKRILSKASFREPGPSRGSVDFIRWRQTAWEFRRHVHFTVLMEIRKMETKFDHGPWEKCCDCGDILQSVHPIRDAKVIATVSPENKAANMALIAAAPDLYAKLSELCDHVESMKYPTELAAKRATQDMRTALAKARGEKLPS